MVMQIALVTFGQGLFMRRIHNSRQFPIRPTLMAQYHEEWDEDDYYWPDEDLPGESPGCGNIVSAFWWLLAAILFLAAPELACALAFGFLLLVGSAIAGIFGGGDD